MFPWSEQSLRKRLKKRRMSPQEEDILDSWSQDVCSGEELPEVEIISLIEEQIPKYKLRADTLTTFAGYENDDWYCPSLKPEDISPLTPEQIRETLNYFFHPPVSGSLSEYLRFPNPLRSVEGLLFYLILIAVHALPINRSEELEILEADGEAVQPLYRLGPGGRLLLMLPSSHLYCSERMRQMNRTYDDIEAVRRLLSEKEHELELVTRIGQNLLSEKTKLQNDLGTLKDELSSANEKITQLSHELTQKTELINNLLSDVDDVRSEGGGFTSQIQLTSLEKKIKTLEEENAGLHWEAARLTQENESCEETEARLVGELTQELNSGREELEMTVMENAKLREERNQMKEIIDHLDARVQSTDEKLCLAVKENEEYIQIINIMRETQGELTAELADSKERYNEVHRFLEEYREEERRSKKKMSPKVRVGPGYCSQLTSMWPPLSKENPESIGAELSASLLSELSLDSGLGASTLDLESHTPVNRLGGGPGSALGYHRDLELEKTLESVTRRDIEERRSSLFWDTGGGCSTPDSFLSQSGYNLSSVKMDKVQLVKPLEGSETLRQWSQLATPSMHGLLEDRPGVKVRGGTELEDLGIKRKETVRKVETEANGPTETYSLSDVEEDEELNPGKSFSDTNHIYTFTNSRILHPTDNIAQCVMTSSSSSSQMVWSSAGLACTPSVPATPTPANSPAMSTPASTPANSPVGSPHRPSSPVSSTALTTALFNPYGYLDMIRKTIGSALSPALQPPKALARPDNKAALRGFRLVERIEQQVGLEEILCREPERGLHRASLLRRGVRSLARGDLLGVPGRPGTGVLDHRLKQLKRRPRTDLGSVQPQLSASSLVFGRKGGLL